MDTWKTKKGKMARCKSCKQRWNCDVLTRVLKNPNHPHKRSLKTMDSIQSAFSKEGLLEIIQRCPDLRTQALMSTLYLTGGRVSEIVNWTDFDSGKKTKGIKKFNFHVEIVDGKKVFWIKGIRVLKARKAKQRSVPISFKLDRDFIWYIHQYIKPMDREEPLFDFSRQYAWQIMNEFGLTPHFFRDLRVMDLQKYYKWNMLEIQKFIGWEKLDTIQEYSKYRPVDLISDRF